MIINCGITAVYFANAYPDEMAERLLAEAGVIYKHLDSAIKVKICE